MQYKDEGDSSRFRRGFLHLALVVISIAILPETGLGVRLQTDPKLRKHLVVYGAINDNQVPYIAEHFQIIVTTPRTLKHIRKIKSLNPDLIALIYKDIFAMHPYYEDWNEVNEHEEYYLHDEVLGLRLREVYFGWHVMDISSRGWIEHYAEHVVDRLDKLRAFDGVFADDVWTDLYFHRFYVDIEDERNIVGSDGKIVVGYPVWNASLYGRRNNITIRLNGGGKGPDFFASGSFSGRTITPGRSLTPGTVVYVSYSAADSEIIRPPEHRIRNWKRDMLQMLRHLKGRLTGELLIINTDDLSNGYLDLVDGMMCEGFGATDSHSWSRQIKSLDSAMRSGKIYLAQSNIKENNPCTEKAHPKIAFALNSYLLGEGPSSTFSLGLKDYATYYFKYPAIEHLILDYERKHQLLGEPIGDYFIIAEGKSEREEDFGNLIKNHSFEEGLSGWKITNRSLGTPGIGNTSSEGSKSAHFMADGGSGSTIMSDFIPILPNTSYEVSVWAKGQGIVAGKPSWRRLCWIGRFYDANRREIPGFAPDLQFGLGDYEWKNYRKTYTSPNNAHFYRITSLGACPGSRGEGWIDRVEFRKNPQPFEYKVYAREFEHGLVLVNAGAAECRLSLDRLYFNTSGERIDEIILNGNEAAALFDR
jgi:hypothetical protein